jgi:hypothetical protein
MIGFILRRFRWMILGAAGKELARRVSRRHVDEARSELVDRLPDRAVTLADRLPGDVLRAAGTAQVATRAANRSARVPREVAQISREVAFAPQRARRRLSEMGEEWNNQVADDELTLRARLIAYTRGQTAADNVLLGGRSSWAEEPMPGVPDSVSSGRPQRSVSRRLVNRMQRTYRPRRHSWK